MPQVTISFKATSTTLCHPRESGGRAAAQIPVVKLDVCTALKPQLLPSLRWERPLWVPSTGLASTRFWIVHRHREALGPLGSPDEESAGEMFCPLQAVKA